MLKSKDSEPILCPLHVILILPELFPFLFRNSCHRLGGASFDIWYPTRTLPFPAIIVLSYRRVPPRTTLDFDYGIGTRLGSYPSLRSLFSLPLVYRRAPAVDFAHDVQ